MLLSPALLLLRRLTCHGTSPHLPAAADMHLQQHGVGPTVAWSELSSQLSAVASNVWMLQSRETALLEQLRAKDE